VVDNVRDVSDAAGGAGGSGKDDGASAPPAGGALMSTPREWAWCQQCQARNAPDARYCERCGAGLTSPEATTLVFDARELHAARVSGSGADADPSGEALVSDPTRASGQVPVLTRTLSGQAAEALLQLVRRELADDYDVEQEIGRGGMAIVYRAVERQLRRTVALKVLPTELMLDPAVVERFKREAQMAAALDHPSIIPIYRVGQTTSLAYLAMRYIEGRPLDRLVADQGALPLPVVLLVLRAAGSALAYAHEHGIVHRDIKGGNILLDREGRVIVTDFGVARAIDNASMTTTGSVIGTPYFMSPEQCAGKVVGPQSDQYSFGVVAFQLLTGAVPFQAETLAAIMHHHFFTPVPDVTKARDDVPPGLSLLLNRILSKHPDRRYASTAELLAAIEAIPLSDQERTRGEAMLRSLAQGTALPVVRTSALPPLADTMAVVAAHDAFMRSADRTTVRHRVSTASLAALALVLALWLWLRPAAPRSVERGDTTRAAVASGTPATPAALPAPVVPRPAPPVAANPIPDGSRPAVVHRPAPARPTSPSVQVVPDTATGTLRVRAVPGDAAIVIDNNVVGQGAIVDREVLAGERHLRVTAPGYVDFDTMIVIKAGEMTRLGSIKLKAAEP
jgi:predicted Ser/Thr protein kinase